MTKTVVFNAKYFKNFVLDFLHQAINNRIKILLSVLLIFGIWCGTSIYISNSTVVSELLSNFFGNMAEKGLIKTFLLLMLINCSLILTVFFSGFSAMGLPLILICPCTVGLITGVVNAWLFNTFKLNGVFFSLTVIIPFSLIEAVMLVFLCNESLAQSSKIVKAVFFSQTSERGEVKGFVIRHTVIAALAAISALVQSLLVVNMTGKLLFV